MKVYLVSDISGGCLKYRLMNVEGITYNASTNPMVLTLPEMDEPLVFNFEGRKNDVTITWKLIESNEDLSEGTNGSAIKTIQEQIDYLSSNFISADIAINVGIVILKDDNTKFLEIYGIPTKLSWRWNGGEMALTVSFSLIQNMMGGVNCEW